jgi:hypothetical protein
MVEGRIVKGREKFGLYSRTPLSQVVENGNRAGVEALLEREVVDVDNQKIARDSVLTGGCFTVTCCEHWSEHMEGNFRQQLGGSR